MARISIDLPHISDDEFLDPASRLPSRAIELAPAALEILKAFDRSVSLEHNQRALIERFVFAVADVLWGGGADRQKYENRRHRKVGGTGPTPPWPKSENVTNCDVLPAGKHSEKYRNSVLLRPSQDFGKTEISSGSTNCGPDSGDFPLSKVVSLAAFARNRNREERDDEPDLSA